jgi:hypothetical protein
VPAAIGTSSKVSGDLCSGAPIFQEFAIAGLIAVSRFSLILFFSYTQSLGVHFGV